MTKPDDYRALDDAVRRSFCAIAPDLARACEEAGQRAHVHVDDLADAIVCDLRVPRGADEQQFFQMVKNSIRRQFVHGRRQFVSL